MSLFENDQYRWRETYFVLFEQARCPSAAEIEKTLKSLGKGYRVTGVRCGESGTFESLTVESPFDFTAMDVSYVSGEDVREQVAELVQEMKRNKPTKREQAQLAALAKCDARFDIYHFQRVMADDGYGEDDEDEFIDPGSLLLVLQRLAKLCHGLGVDPQAGLII